MGDVRAAAIGPEWTVGAVAPGGNGLVAELSGLAEQVVDAAHEGRQVIVGGSFVGHESKINANTTPRANARQMATLYSTKLYRANGTEHRRYRIRSVSGPRTR